uniref:CFEM domain-containing protein n=1 Tax=Bionectria ochroleuca TaxID=29856 RepID=A0A8H7MZF4_BIOOC
MRIIGRASWLAASVFLVASTFFTTAASADLTLADVLKALPSCSYDCLTLLTESSDCATGNMTCYCASPNFDDTATACVESNCKLAKDILTVKNVTQVACKREVRDNTKKFPTVAIVFSILSGIFVIQRFAVKIYASNLSLGLDDWITLLAALIQAPGAAIACEGGRRSGFGRDIWTLQYDQITDFGYYLYIYSTIYFFNVSVCKLAFLFFYLRVFPAPRVRRALWGTIIFVLTFGLVFLFVSIFQCKPVSYYWHRWDKEHVGTCINASAVAWANSGISIGLDFFMIGIPLSQINSLNLDWKKKIGVGAMFCVGLFVTIISIIRLENLIVHGWESPNATYEKVDVAVWSTIEINVGIICACMPSLRSLIVRTFPRLHIWPSEPGTRQDFTERNLGFGTTSRSMAEKHPDMPLPTRPGAIALHMTYAVEFGARDSESMDEQRLMQMRDLDTNGSTASPSRSPSDKLRGY